MNKKQNLRLLKALSEETRYRIIEVLLKGEVCACKIPALIGRTQSNTSMHLSKLVELGIVQFRKVGKTSPYSIKDEMVYDIFKIFGYGINKKQKQGGQKTMKIELLETGCSTCIGLEDNVREALQKTGKRAEIIIINEFNDIIKKGVMSTPAIIIDGKIKSSGEVVDVKKIEGWLNEK
jgi:ArsR family transcriptional regulator, lead/cadmium/zinc/bismuth-responsive transcriptional repressor